MPRKTRKQMRGDAILRVRPEPLARQIREALDPERAPGRPKVWADMSKAERDAITATYKRGK